MESPNRTERGGRRWNAVYSRRGRPDTVLGTVVEASPSSAERRAADSMSARDEMWRLSRYIADFGMQTTGNDDPDGLDVYGWQYLVRLYEDPQEVDDEIMELCRDYDGDSEAYGELHDRICELTGTGFPFSASTHSVMKARGRYRWHGTRTASS